MLTTRYVIKNNSPVVNVIYDEDDDWQFLGAEEIDESNAVVLSMKEMIKHDSTLYTVPELEYGRSAVRENIHSLWRIE
ncbi:hypothetical protein [Treponema pedis]|uniref:hypothetical protein n=1 Tax=Treponema pedis TaxID=409322 RepID=UPI000428C683|nr:hypothetical protein [Treponema pedis]